MKQTHPLRSANMSKRLTNVRASQFVFHAVTLAAGLGFVVAAMPSWRSGPQTAVAAPSLPSPGWTPKLEIAEAAVDAAVRDVFDAGILSSRDSATTGRAAVHRGDPATEPAAQVSSIQIEIATPIAFVDREASGSVGLMEGGVFEGGPAESEPVADAALVDASVSLARKNFYVPRARQQGDERGVAPGDSAPLVPSSGISRPVEVVAEPAVVVPAAPPRVAVPTPTPSPSTAPASTLPVSIPSPSPSPSPAPSPLAPVETPAVIDLVDRYEPVEDEPVVAPEAGFPVRVYSWNGDDEFAVLMPAVLVARLDTPAQVVARCREAWADLDPRERCLMLAMQEIHVSKAYARPLPELVKHDAEMGTFEAWWPAVLDALAAADLLPHRLAIDWEAGYGYWHLPSEGAWQRRHSVLRPVWEDPEALAMLPPSLQALTYAQVDWFTGKAGVALWNRWHEERRSTMLRRVFAQPLWERKPDALVTNYQDARFETPMFDANGWRRIDVMVGHEASPSLYSTTPQHNLELVASATAGTGRPVVPWVSHPSYIGREAWRETIIGLYDLGVREFLFWNPASHRDADDQRFAAEVFENLDRLSLERAAFD